MNNDSNFVNDDNNVHHNGNENVENYCMSIVMKMAMKAIIRTKRRIALTMRYQDDDVLGVISITMPSKMTIKINNISIFNAIYILI